MLRLACLVPPLILPCVQAQEQDPSASSTPQQTKDQTSGSNAPIGRFVVLRQ